MLSRNTLRRPAAHQRLVASMLALVSAAVLVGLPDQTEAQGLIGGQSQFIGNPPCSHWVTMSPSAQFAWTNQFLTAMSYGNEAFRRKGQQQFKNDEGIEPIAKAITAHCADNPNDLAADVAGPFLNR